MIVGSCLPKAARAARREKVFRYMKTDTLKSFALAIPVAFLLLTRLPLPRLPDSAFENASRAVWAYPIIGAVLGGTAGLLSYAAISAGLPVMIAAGLALIILACCTGAMHEDGLCDVADGFWGGLTRDRRLAIMKDSQIGTYGTLALVLMTGLRWMAYAAFLPVSIHGIVVAATVSRATMPVLMYLLPHARDSGLSHTVGRPEAVPVLCGILLALALALLSIGFSATISAGLAACIGTAGMFWLARCKIGGQTGDVLGATQVITEVCILCALTLVLL